MSLLGVLVASVAQVVGFAGAGASLVYWSSAPVSPVSIQLFASLWLSAIFAAALALFALRKRSWLALSVADDPAQRALFGWGSLHQLAALAGLLNVLCGVLITYASPPNHTPPLIQAILTNTAPLFAVPFSKAILGDRKQYCAVWPLAAGGVVALGVLVSLLPTLREGRPDEDAELGWVAVFLLSMVPAAAYSVVQQRFLLDSGLLRPGVPHSDVLLGTLRLLAYSFAYQPLWLLALAVPIDLWAGEPGASTLGVFLGLLHSLSCSLTGTGVDCLPDLDVWAGDVPVPVWATVYVVSDAMYFAGLAALSLESATFALLLNVAGSGLLSLYFLAPGTNPAPAVTPAWSVALSLVLCCSGVAAFKQWEMRTPVHAQFAVDDAAPPGGALPAATAAAGAPGAAASAPPRVGGALEATVAADDGDDGCEGGEMESRRLLRAPNPAVRASGLQVPGGMGMSSRGVGSSLRRAGSVQASAGVAQKGAPVSLALAGCSGDEVAGTGSHGGTGSAGAGNLKV